MKKIENYLNVLHFCFYRFHYKLHLLSNKINPFHLIHKLPFQKRRYEELGIDIHKEIDKSFGNKTYGLSITVAGGALLGILFFFFLTVINFFKSLFISDIILSLSDFIVCGILTITISYFFVFKKDKYLEYFKKYESWSRSEKKKYGWISFSFILLVLVLFIGNFML